MCGHICLRGQEDYGKVNDGVVENGEMFCCMNEKKRIFHNYIENVFFIVILAFYPLIHINQGLDVADTTYSLGNFQYFDSADGTWMVATYMANVLGHALTGFPRGNTMIGMQFYTGLIVSVLAVFFYLMLRRKMPSIIAFAGEMLAISLCWCPTVILYNYLTYFLMGIGGWLLYLGCFQVEGNRRRKWYLVIAGLCLGANIMVRMPNVVQASFILVLWYSAFLQKKVWRTVVRDTLYCLAGYLLGFAVPFAAVCMRYGTEAYPEMVWNMFAMTDQAVDYKPASMITHILNDYEHGLYWLFFAAVCMMVLYSVYICCYMLNRGKARKTAAGQSAKTTEQICVWLFCLFCVGVWCVLIRFYWGRGMFHFRYYYYDYVCMYWWAVLFLLTGIAGALWMLIGHGISAEDRTLALFVLLQILLTPLGSNNGLAPIINNLFIAAPFIIWCVYRWFRLADGDCQALDTSLYGKLKRNIGQLPWQSMLLIFGIMLCVQSTGFHWEFVFGDGVWGEVRDTFVAEPPKAEGIYTNRENAECLSDLVVYARENRLIGKQVILYGEIPGISYLLGMPGAISTTWPDLDSYRMSQFEEDIKTVINRMEEERPVVIVSSGVAAYYTEDAEAYEWFGVNPEDYGTDRKMEMLRQFLTDYDYQETFSNMRYVVYE